MRRSVNEKSIEVLAYRLIGQLLYTHCQRFPTTTIRSLRVEEEATHITYTDNGETTVHVYWKVMDKWTWGFAAFGVASWLTAPESETGSTTTTTTTTTITTHTRNYYIFFPYILSSIFFLTFLFSLLLRKFLVAPPGRIFFYLTAITTTKNIYFYICMYIENMKTWLPCG